MSEPYLSAPSSPTGVVRVGLPGRPRQNELHVTPGEAGIRAAHERGHTRHDGRCG